MIQPTPGSIESDPLAAVWRETGRHLEIATAVAAIADVLVGRFPLTGIHLVRLVAESHGCEVVASAGSVGANPPGAPAVALAPAPWRRLVAWVRSGAVSGTDEEAVAPLVAATRPERGGVAGGLCGVDGPIGAVVFVPAPGAAFSAADRALVARLLEPFAVALENDARLHELRSLRQAAEADRRSLLSRLGRQEIAEDVVGARTGLRHVMERVELVARSDVPVLILGETGTGKEVVARAIHTRSKRADGPFIRVNCGAIPPELVDSQLFGHEKGSFTGAADQHQGWFERADRGTLFLDEIGELPLPAQVRLLRVLQDHQIERVGGKAPVRVDVRIVAATHRDLAAMVTERSFREDLWYRINVFPILLPTLRERREDIPALVRHFAHRAAVRFGLPEVDPTSADLLLLGEYDWPGNIRELGAVIDRAAILGGGRRLDVAAALGLGRRPPPPAPATDPTLFEVVPEGVPPASAAEPAPSAADIVPLAVAMRRHVERALAATRGRIEGPRGAAALLQINPHTLRARMRKLGIDPGRFRE
ncbi:MAG: sigma-54 dependent transcriptional regulator [Planctomycetes bacterium]|nr:sigma-54 dependent transcriptional regulator [Planctomycetota bacterium]